MKILNFNKKITVWTVIMAFLASIVNIMGYTYPVRAAVLPSYQASAAFSTTCPQPGTNIFRYQYAPIGQNDYTDYNYYENGWWKDRKGNWAGGSVVNSTRIQPGTTSDVVLTFVAPYTGNISMTWNGQLGITSGYPSVDGVKARILQGNTQLWPQTDWMSVTVTAPVAAPVSNTITANVIKGDLIHFRLNMNGNSTSDDTTWDPIIQYTYVASNDAAVVAAPGRIDAANKTITDVVYGMTVDNFKAAITVSTGGTFQICREDGTTPADKITDGYKVVVTAEDKVTTCVYEIRVLPPGDDTAITSNICEVVTGPNNDGRITMRPGISIGELRASITVPNGSTFQIYRSDGRTVATDLQSGDLLIVTAQDGITKRTYVLRINIPVSRIAVDKGQIQIFKGEKGQIAAVITPTNASDQRMVWSSSDQSIADVNENGEIYAVSAGRAVITVMAEDHSLGAKAADIQVEVLEKPVRGVILSSHVLAVNVNHQIALTASIIPEGADHSTIKWSSDNKNVAVVTEDGIVKGIAPGTAYVTASMESGWSSDTCKIIVSPYIASTGFTTDLPQTGKSNWRYQYVTSGGSDYRDYNFVRTTDSTWWLDKGANWPGGMIAKDHIQPGGSFDAVRTFVAPAPGKVRISSNGKITVSFSASNGVDVKIMKGAEQLWPQSGWTTVQYGSPVDVPEIDTDVNEGDPIYFIIDKHGSDASDDTAWDPVVTYVDGIDVSGIGLNTRSMELKLGETGSLIPVIYPQNAANRAVQWSSENDAIAAVDNMGKVIAKSVGTVLIFAQTQENGFIASCRVTVKNPDFTFSDILVNSSGSRINVNFNITSNYMNAPVTMILTLSDSNSHIQKNSVLAQPTQIIRAGTQTRIDASVDVGGDLSGKSVQILLWESLESVRPLVNIPLYGGGS